MRTRMTLLAAAAVILAACDTRVTNPGPVQDEFLEERSAQTALVSGAGRALSSGLNWISYTSAAITREIHPAGSTGSFGITNRWQGGELNADDSALDTHWEQAQRARWLAEEAIRRIEDPEVGALNQNVRQQAYVWAGFANRLLGENMCQAVIDGGPAMPSTEFLMRAEDHFTKAIAVQTGAMETASYGGRASVRAYQGKWPEAVSDAARVPTAFVYNVAYFNLGEDAQRNRIFYAVGNTPYRAHTQWNTWYDEYARATTDPRVPITITELLGDAAIECCGRVPFWPQAKYTSSASPIRLTSGREMRLLEAEAALRASNVTGALTLINAVRTAANAPTVTAATLTEAWTLLKRERGIELWLEARRLGDLRRWQEGSTPGALHPLEQPGAGSHLVRQDLCFPVSRSERDTNPNFR